MQRVLIWLAALCALLVTLAGLVIGAGYAWLRATVPSASGRLVLEGIAAPVAITRDREYVPHVFAKSRRDLLFALGLRARAGPSVADGAVAPQRARAACRRSSATVPLPPMCSCARLIFTATQNARWRR